MEFHCKPFEKSIKAYYSRKESLQRTKQQRQFPRRKPVDKVINLDIYRCWRQAQSLQLVGTHIKMKRKLQLMTIAWYLLGSSNIFTSLPLRKLKFQWVKIPKQSRLHCNPKFWPSLQHVNRTCEMITWCRSLILFYWTDLKLFRNILHYFTDTLPFSVIKLKRKEFTGTSRSATNSLVASTFWR